MSDTDLQDIQDQLRQLKRGQRILAVMICVFGLCWGLSKVFPAVAQIVQSSGGM